ncbi:glucose-1-phosphate cytidylyltransferase [Nocardioides lentus]|uniref:Glucose-1-phosphate cytidylyltransferase n=1 Tax=Nocardioides lentus TaxID=338077 RepID=A0ABP5AQL3_9ACTN
MKVVLFCGGLGMRMRTGPESLPKPMMPIGSRPVLWHVMRYYAHFGHREFILCLGHGSQAVKDYFLDYRETRSNDFVLRNGGRDIEMLSTDISDWTITFADTGIDAAIGERLRRVRHHLDGDEMFLANYGDVLTDAPMDEIVEGFAASDAVGSMLTVKPQDSFHVVGIEDGRVTGLTAVADMDMRINGGYFVFRQSIFDYLGEGEDLVMHACVRAAAEGRIRAVEYDGFWAPMDTLKERSALEEQYRHGVSPWTLWRPRSTTPGREVPRVDVESPAAGEGG